VRNKQVSEAEVPAQFGQQLKNNRLH
jgi:hypothetical protein